MLHFCRFLVLVPRITVPVPEQKQHWYHFFCCNSIYILYLSLVVPWYRNMFKSFVCELVPQLINALICIERVFRKSRYLGPGRYKHKQRIGLRQKKNGTSVFLYHDNVSLYHTMTYKTPILANFTTVRSVFFFLAGVVCG